MSKLIHVKVETWDVVERFKHKIVTQSVTIGVEALSEKTGKVRNNQKSRC